jgi:hypothetical protein
MRLFVSYARQDRPAVEPLAQRLRQVGNTVWLDTDLSGGQVWWDKILDQLRQCDAVLTIVSRASLHSQACTVERRYAAQLGRSVLPLAIEPVGPAVVPTDIARLQILDYSKPSDSAAFTLIEAINRLPEPRPLPDPMPPPPLPPTSYWDTIADQLSADVLTLDQQLALIGRLEGAFASYADPADKSTAFELLDQMERRTDLYAAVDRRITTLRNRTRTGTEQAPSANRGQHGPQPGPSGTPGATGPAGTGRATAGAGSAADGTRFAHGVHPSAPGGQFHEPGGVPPGPGWRGSGPAAGSWQAPPQPGWPGGAGPAPRVMAVTPHWGMAIWTLFLFWPVGIPALVFASRVRPGLMAGNVAEAQQAASRVKLFFWISLAVGIPLWLVVIADASTASQTGALLITARP